MPYIFLDASLEEGSSETKPCYRKQVTREEMKHSGDYTMHLRKYLPPLLDLVDQYTSDRVEILGHNWLWVPSRVRIGDDEYFQMSSKSGGQTSTIPIMSFYPTRGYSRPSRLARYLLPIHGFVTFVDLLSTMTMTVFTTIPPIQTWNTILGKASRTFAFSH